MSLSEIIRNDDLYWCETDKKFVPLSPKEIESFIMMCAVCGIEGTEDVTRVIRWAEEVRIGELMFKGIMDKRLGFRLDENKEPSFFALTPETMDALDNIADDDLEDF
ncbi:MAG: hypothetical protein ACXADB_07220 [Candidatus Hermodarchaeia archaeon]|jgi:hypothetical protein